MGITAPPPCWRSKQSPISPGSGPLVFGAEPRAEAEATLAFSGLPGEALTTTVQAAPSLIFDRETPFGYRQALNYQIVANWLIAEHKSQGLFQKDSGRHRFEQFWLFTTGGETAPRPLSQLQSVLDPSHRQTLAQKGIGK
ncbi:MAG: hypothetical protein WDO73_17585 [Ignavibacteriota bacterium]